MQDRPGHHHPLGHASRQREGVGLGAVAELEPLEQLVGRGSGRLRAHAEVAAVEVEVLEHGEAAVERVHLGDHADELLRERGLGHDVDVADERLSIGGDDARREHAHGGGLARTVGAEETEDLALADREVEVVDGPHGRRTTATGELLGEADAPDHLGAGERGHGGAGGRWARRGIRGFGSH